jgi:hypothetical protein
MTSPSTPLEAAEVRRQHRWHYRRVQTQAFVEDKQKEWP